MPREALGEAEAKRGTSRLLSLPLSQGKGTAFLSPDPRRPEPLPRRAASAHWCLCSLRGRGGPGVVSGAYSWPRDPWLCGCVTAAGPHPALGRLVLNDHLPSPTWPLPGLSSVIKSCVSSWQFRLVLSSLFPLPTLGGQPVLFFWGPSSRLQRDRGSPGPHSTCSPPTKKPAPSVTPW